jgi:hypothetical protein
VTEIYTRAGAVNERKRVRSNTFTEDIIPHPEGARL